MDSGVLGTCGYPFKENIWYPSNIGYFGYQIPNLSIGYWSNLDINLGYPISV
ncbi:uncharacterized protein G2W53_039605 [Senna tora]|uniref:Uncharacterized protein n=1 Tax=Senna tora TaxID=362788 RepID=A0A834SNW0_9FABA|nr:uncharacterized protein G2W53_039605 [Senna tora]